MNVLDLQEMAVQPEESTARASVLSLLACGGHHSTLSAALCN
jgi:hypothetical protein